MEKEKKKQKITGMENPTGRKWMESWGIANRSHLGSAHWNRFTDLLVLNAHYIPFLFFVVSFPFFILLIRRGHCATGRLFETEKYDQVGPFHRRKTRRIETIIFRNNVEGVSSNGTHFRPIIDNQWQFSQIFVFEKKSETGWSCRENQYCASLIRLKVGKDFTYVNTKYDLKTRRKGNRMKRMRRWTNSSNEQG